jgi:hypothetical protein
MAVVRRIFISMPADKWLTENQNALKWAIVKKVEKLGYVPEVFTSNTRYFKKSIAAPKQWSAGEAYKVALRCSGAIIIGLPRWTTQIGNDTVLFASEFCHYEGALFKSLQLPTLVVKQSNIRDRVVFNYANEENIIEFDEKDDQRWVRSPRFRISFDYWKNKLKERRDVFLGYCGSSSSTANEIKKYLTKELKVTVLDWQKDFSAADTILQQIGEATRRCKAAVFLFTKDDYFIKKKDGKKAIPRDNVVFEAGYFINAKGNSQVLIILESGAKMPSDLGGKIYASLPDKANIIPVKSIIKKFVNGF